MKRKEKILEAMQIILQEYRDKTHVASIYCCQLCNLFYTPCSGPERHNCHKCPMFIFTKGKKDREISCLQRKCKPIYCLEGQKTSKGLQRVTEFYERAIEGLQKLTNEDLGKKDCFQYLIEIDKEVYEKYRTKKKV